MLSDTERERLAAASAEMRQAGWAYTAAIAALDHAVTTAEAGGATRSEIEEVVGLSPAAVRAQLVAFTTANVTGRRRWRR